MGVFNKLKGIFYDEVVVDDKDEELEKIEKIVKKEEVVEKPKVEKIDFSQFEEPAEKKEVKVENTFNERELFRSERTFNFTEFEDDEIDLPPRKTVLNTESRNSRVATNSINSSINNSRLSQKTSTLKPAVSEPPKVFKPSPIISPIYGILDKDYKREEIVSKQVNNDVSVKSKVTTYDTVRRKAYGTLEDDLEDTLNSLNKITTSDINEEIQRDVTFEDKKSKIEDLISKIEDVSDELDKTMSVGDLEDRVVIDNFEEEFSDKTMTDSSLEHDLFNLIDSMYDDKED